MRIFAYIDKGEDISHIKKGLDKVFKIEWVEQEHDFSHAPWQSYSQQDQLGISKQYVQTQAKEVHKKEGEHIDIVAFFVSEKNWKDGRSAVWGWHDGTPYSGYQTIQVRLLRDEVEALATAWHEIMHTLDNIIKIETGVNISEKLGVNDYDNDIVHSPRGRNNTNRHATYLTALDTIEPYLKAAITTRRERFKQTLLETALRLARTLLVQLQAKVTPIPPESTEEKLLQPIVAHKAEQLIALASLHGLDLRITEGFRSIERQNELYAQGRTTPGNIVTNAKGGESYHNFAVSFDVVDRKKGYDINWELVGKIGKTLGLEWGGDWTSFPDRPHFQYTAGFSLKDFQSGQVDYKKFNTETYA